MGVYCTKIVDCVMGEEEDDGYVFVPCDQNQPAQVPASALPGHRQQPLQRPMRANVQPFYAPPAASPPQAGFYKAVKRPVGLQMAPPQTAPPQMVAQPQMQPECPPGRSWTVPRVTAGYSSRSSYSSYPSSRAPPACLNWMAGQREGGSSVNDSRYYDSRYSR